MKFHARRKPVVIHSDNWTQTDPERDHFSEITQLKEKIASMSKTISMMSKDLTIEKDKVSTLNAKLFSEEKLNREKQKKQKVEYEKKVADMQCLIKQQQSELVKLRKIVRV